MKGNIKLYCELTSKFTFKNGKSSEDLYKVLDKYSIGSYTRSTFKSMKERFLQEKELENMSKTTLGMYKNTSEKLELYLRDTGVTLNQISKQTLKSYIDFISKKGLKSSSIAYYISVIRVFFNWMEDEYLIDVNPTKGLKYKTPKSFRHAISDADVDIIRRNCTNVRDRALIEFLLTTGCRVSEVINIKTKDVDFVHNEIKVTGKGNKERTVLFTDNTKALLELNLKKSKNKEYLFSAYKHPYNKLERFAVNALIKRLSEDTQIKIHPHLFRHTFATKALNGGMDIVSIQKLLGHDYISTTQVYAEMTLDTVRKNYRKVFK